MPFKSKSQMRAAFGGFLGKEMKTKAKTWAKETPSIKALPNKVKSGKLTVKAAKTMPMAKLTAKLPKGPKSY